MIIYLHIVWYYKEIGFSKKICIKMEVLCFCKMWKYLIAAFFLGFFWQNSRFYPTHSFLGRGRKDVEIFVQSFSQVQHDQYRGGHICHQIFADFLPGFAAENYPVSETVWPLPGKILTYVMIRVAGCVCVCTLRS